MKEEPIILETSEPIRMGFHWPKYRIRESRDGGYYVQYRFLFWWEDFVNGNFADGYRRLILPSIDAAKLLILKDKESKARKKQKDPIVYQE